MAFIMIARALVLGVGAAVAVSQVNRVIKKPMQETCFLCGAMVETKNTTTCNLRCGHKFHKSCMRAYVHSLRHCTMKCPVDKCTEKHVMGDAERRHFELWAPDDIFYCQFCLKTNKKNIAQRFPCCHSFCKSCLKSYIGANQLMNLPPKCPMTECAAEIPDYVTKLILKQ